METLEALQLLQTMSELHRIDPTSAVAGSESACLNHQNFIL